MTVETTAKLYLELANLVGDQCKTARELEVEALVKKALFYLDQATPKQRNGPTYQAADTLRAILGLPPMEIGGKTTDGLDT